MPPPLPLTAAPTPRLDWSRQTTPIAEAFDDIYFSTDGGVEETETVFLGGCGLPARWQTGEDHVIGELGFGSGLNFLTAWQAFERSTTPPQKLDFISVEKFPFTRAMLERAVSYWPRLAAQSKRLLALWPGPVKGVHRLDLTPQVTLTLYIEDVETALDQISGPIDSWFLDGFSPAKNPEMWSPNIMNRLAARSHDETRLSTFTVAGHVRRALTQAGFTVSKTTGFGRKRHRLEAHFQMGPKKPQTPEIHPVIIGGGIAGASLCRAAKRQGLTPRLIHNDINMTFAASGNPAAMVKPRLDLQDRPESRFFLASYLYALRAYEDCGANAVLSRGITQIAKDDRENARFQKIIAQAPLPAEHLGAYSNGLYFPSALTINPKAVISGWIDGVDSDVKTAARLSKKGPIWDIQDASGQLIAASETMIIASGAGVRDIQLPNGNTIAQDLSLRFSRGQLTWAQGDLDRPTAYGGYAIPLKGDILLGATHDRLDARDDYALRDEDNAHNLQTAQTYLQRYLTGPLTAMKRKGRASLRVTTGNTLPQLTEIEDGLWIMTGLGSRGFVFAPLLADHLISKLTHKAPSVTPQMWSKLSQNK